MSGELIPVAVGHAQMDGKGRKCIFLAGQESIVSSSHTEWTDKFTFWAYKEPVRNSKKISLWFVNKSADGQARWKIREEHGSDHEEGWTHQTNLYVPDAKQPGLTRFKVFSAKNPSKPKHHRFLISPTSSEGDGTLSGWDEDEFGKVLDGWQDEGWEFWAITSLGGPVP
jgi:hypothetical protein